MFNERNLLLSHRGERKNLSSVQNEHQTIRTFPKAKKESQRSATLHPKFRFPPSPSPCLR